MKIVLLHGDDKAKVQERSKAIVNGVQKKGWKVERADKYTDLSTLFMSNALIPETKLVVVEGVGNVSAANIRFLKSHETIEGSLLIVHAGKAPKKSLQPLKKLLTEEQFDVPQLLFKFLDTLYPGNAHTAVATFHQLLESEPKELAFTLMASHMRDLMWAKYDHKSMPYPDWRKKKLLLQVQKYSPEVLSHFIDGLAMADMQSKTGGMDLLTSLDILIAKELR